MKLSALPQAAAEKLLDLDEHVARLLTEATSADAALEHARSIINNTREVSREEYTVTKEVFNDVHAAAKTARARADSARAILQAVREWVERLPPDTRLSLAQATSSSDLDLAALTAQLAAMRDDLRSLNNNPPVSPDIGQKIDAYVGALAGAALPFVRGFQSGAALDIRFPSDTRADRRTGNDCDTNGCNALLTFAALFPKELSKLITRAITQTQPLSQGEHAARRSELERAIDETSYTVSALRNEAGELPDPLCGPQHFLGVRMQPPPGTRRSPTRALSLRRSVRDNMRA